jgi:phage antirepressor YoqD-like protein
MKVKESATAGTLFHRVKFGIQKAFCIAFEMTCTTKSISSTQTAKRYGITQKTSWLFMQKVRLAMKSSKQYPMTGNVQVDEFVVGGKETGKQGRSYDSKKTKVVCAVELTER